MGSPTATSRLLVIVRHTRCQKISYCYIMKVAILAVTALALVQCTVAITREYPVVRAQKYCYDQSPGCEEYAKAGECDSNPDFMHAHCKVTCDLCEKGSLLKPAAEVRAQKYCYDQSPGCAEYAKAGECDSNPDFMHAHCKVTCDLCEKGSLLKPAAEVRAQKYCYDQSPGCAEYAK